MKGQILSFLFICSGFTVFSQANDPALMKINGVDIKKSEFEYIYNKNNTVEAVEQKNIDEYLELFKNFKLKVFEAKAQGLDTLPSFKNELGGYRRQLSRPYLEDKETDEIFAKEAYDRMKEIVSVSHILIRFPERYTVADTLDAYKRILEIRDRVVSSGKKKKAVEDFNEVAKEVSEDPSVESNAGRLGYLTAFSTVYPFENMAYKTAVGQISMPVRSNFGYHLIKVEDRKADPGEVFTAHIMVEIPRDADEASLEKAKNKIDSIYNLIQNGLDFSEAAKELSDDKGTAQRGGELPWFGIGRMIKEFENTAFSLKKGDVSKPFKTAFGYHIMKVIDTRNIGTYEEKQAEIKSMIARSDRGQYMRNASADRLKKEFNYQPNKTAFNALIAFAADKASIDSLFIVQAKNLKNETLFSIDNTPYTQSQFISFLETQSNSVKTTPTDVLTESYDRYVNNMLFDYQDKSLEKRYPDFANLMNEYHDGILLFEISNKEVWEKASKDTEGLQQYFSAHKSDYRWDKPHYKGYVISCADKKIQKEAEKLIKKLPSDSIPKILTKTFNSSENTGVKIDRVLTIQGDNEAVDCFAFKSINKNDYKAPEKFPYVFVTGKMLNDGPESYEDVRGLVTSDYQNYLEDEWIKYLRNKYTIEVDNNVLNTIKSISSK